MTSKHDTAQPVHAPWADVDNAENPQLLVAMMDAFNATPWLQQHKTRALRTLVKLVSNAPRASFLEVGCGTGEDAQALALQCGQHCSVVGLDNSRLMTSEALRRAVPQGLSLTFQQGDTYALPFSENTFDASYCLVTFDILQHPAAALREMARVTKPGGTVFVSASDHGTLVIDAPDQQLTRTLTSFFCDSVYNGRIGRQLPALFANAGLHETSVLPDTVTLQSPDYPVARQVLLENIVAGAQAAGLTSKKQGDEWLASLDEAYRGGTFFAASTFFMVAGTKAA